MLDFGCGFGASSYCLARRGADRIVATDLEPGNLEVARQVFLRFGLDDRIELRGDDMLPTLGPGSFDIVWLQAVVEHLTPEERRTYLRRFWAALRPGGWLVISETPNRVWPREDHTTGGRWFLPWMRPDTVFRVLRREEAYRSFSDEEFYRSGVIGSTYGEILRCLGRPGDCVPPARATRSYLARLSAHRPPKSLPRSLLVKGLGLFEPVVRAVSGRPVTAFLPYLNHLAFRKAGQPPRATEFQPLTGTQKEAGSDAS